LKNEATTPKALQRCDHVTGAIYHQTAGRLLDIGEEHLRLLIHSFTTEALRAAMPSSIGNGNAGQAAELGSKDRTW